MDLGGARCGSAWSSRVASPPLKPSMHPEMEFYDESRVYGRNHIHVTRGSENLRGYLALYTRPGCGSLLSWVPFSVLSGIKKNNPDVDKEILVQLHNVSSFVVRTFPALPRSGQAAMEVIIYGVDGNAYPGFRFPEGGAEHFVDAISEAYVIEKIGEREVSSGLRDETYKLVKPIKRAATKAPQTTPRKSTSASSYSPSATTSPGNFLTRMFRRPLAGSNASVDSAVALMTVEENVERFIRGRNKKSMQKLLVAWRLFTYRQIKMRHDVASLVTRTTSTSRFPWAHLSPHGESPLGDAELNHGLTEELWCFLSEPVGSVKDQVGFYRAIVGGGVTHARRSLVWRILLQQYGLHHSKLERDARDAEVEAAYQALNTEYKLAALSKVDTNLNLTRFIEHCDVIDQDVERSDFHEDETGEYGRMLRSILRTFVWHNPDPGYVQGMLDLLEPILYVTQNESSAHYCFTHLLERSGPKFDRTAEFGIEVYLSKLRSLMAYEEPELGIHLKNLDADHLFFSYRWFLLDFKREFSKDDVLHLWEAIWASEILHSEFTTVFVALVVIQGYKAELLNCRNSTEILKLFNSQGSSKLNAQTVASRAVNMLIALKKDLRSRGMVLDQA